MKSRPDTVAHDSPSAVTAVLQHSDERDRDALGNTVLLKSGSSHLVPHNRLCHMPRELLTLRAISALTPLAVSSAPDPL